MINPSKAVGLKTKKNLLNNYRTELTMAFTLFALFILLTFLSPYFLTKSNLINVIYQISTIGILAVGQTLVILTGGFDLSIGSIFSLTGWVMCTAILHIGLLPGLIVGLLVGGFVGLINGTLVSYLKLSPFVVTLGMMSVVSSITYVISDARSVINLPKSLARFDEITVLGIPSYVILTILFFIAGQLFLSYTKAGRFIISIGSNEKTSEYSGINVKLYKVIPYVTIGMTAAIAAFVQASRLMAADPNAGNGLELQTIAAVVIGGASLAGGKGSMIGTLIGALIMGLLRNGLNLLGVNAYWQGTAVGAVIIIAVAIEKIANSRKNR